MRLYQEHSIDIQASIFLGAYVIILTSSLLKRVYLSVDILSPSIWAKVKGTDVSTFTSPYTKTMISGIIIK